MLLVVIFLGDVYRLRQHVKILQGQVDKTNPQAREIESKKNQLNVINAEIDIELSPLMILTGLYKIVPNDVYVSQFEYREGTSVLVRGSAIRRPDVFTLVRNMEKSEMFTATELRGGITTRRIQGKEFYDFSIVGVLNP